MDWNVLEFDRRLLAFISNSQGEFNALAVELFAYQFTHNAPYRCLCLSRSATPGTVSHWSQIPAAPVQGFKAVELACQPVNEAQAVFFSSGTTRGAGQRSRHCMFNLELYRAAILRSFREHVVPDFERMLMLILVPSPEEAPQSSLAFMMGVVRHEFGTEGSGHFVGGAGIHAAALASTLAAAKGPVCLLSTSLALLEFLNWCEANGQRFALPLGSRVMDTGGFKGQRVEVTREELYRRCGEALGVADEFIVNEYGMCEMSSQFYDRIAGTPGLRLYRTPPWVRTVVVDPETMEPVPEGQVGLLRHYDLANRGSVMAVQTEDVGRIHKGAFEMLGRLPGAEPRGCSLMVEEMLAFRQWEMGDAECEMNGNE